MNKAQIGRIAIAYVAGIITAVLGWILATNEGPPDPTKVQAAQPATAPSAPPTKQSLSAEEKNDICKSYAQYARATMEARQNGAEMSKIVEISGSGGKVDPIIQEMIIKAYEAPRMSVKENQDRQVRDFENQYFLECTKGLASRS